MATEKTDVVIVGVGAVGGILAAELGKAGMKVIGLERGPRLTTQDFSALDELRYFQSQELRHNAKRQPVTWRRDAKPTPAILLKRHGVANTRFPPCCPTNRASSSQRRLRSSAIIRSPRRARFSHSLITDAPAAPTAVSASPSAVTWPQNPAFLSRSFPKPMPPAISSCSPARWPIA